MNYKYKLMWTTKGGLQVEDANCTIETLPEVLKRLEQFGASNIALVQVANKPEIEVFYTGGGIWLAGADLTETTYAIVDDEWECFTIYDRSEEDAYGDDSWPCQNMVESYDSETVPEEFRALYKRMLKQLKKESF